MQIKKTIFSFVFVLILIVISTTATAIRFDVEQAMQEEWDRYDLYKNDYIKFNDLKPFEDHVSEYNVQRSFGFYSPGHYYISPEVWAAKYYPPLQGEAYMTPTRYGTSLTHQPSAIQFYGEEVNGRTTGYIPSTLTNGRYFDHPQAYGTYGHVTAGYYGYQGEPAYYARIAQNQGNGFYIVGFY